MNITDIRLKCQQISTHRFSAPGEIAAWMGALQAQDLNGAMWSIALRLPFATVETIEEAIADRTIVRTWPMRGTLHIVAGDDVHWMLALLNPRVIAGMAGRAQALELAANDFVRCETACVDALRGGRQLTRDNMYSLFESAGVSAAGPRGYHIISRLCHEGVICFGAHKGKQPSFALLDEWCPPKRTWSREESLAELTKRYFSSHGPAKLDDYVRWSGLTTEDARAGLSMTSSSISSAIIEGRTYWLPQDIDDSNCDAPSAFLLPGFDEYMLGYRDRSAALEPKYNNAICPGANGVFTSTLIVNGNVVGTWNRVVKKDFAHIRLSPFVPLSSNEKEAIVRAAESYGDFLGKKVNITG